MDLYPVKAQYLTGQEVILHLEMEKPEKISSVQIEVYHLENCVKTITLSEVDGQTNVVLGRFYDLFAGYGVVAKIACCNQERYLFTAFDVVEYPGKSLRYGFLSDFTENDRSNGAIEWMRKYHINLVQFYDWSYRHDELVSDQEIYSDMMGKHIVSSVVKEKIMAAKELGMLPMAYGAIYAASQKFYKAHKDWGYYTSNFEPFVFIDTFYIMNISQDSPWKAHLFKQYENAMRQMGFMGIHMDTYGFPKTAWSHFNNQWELKRLDCEFPSLIDDARSELNSKGLEPYLIFNNVGNWPVYATASSNQDAIYIEVWDPYNRYCHIAQLIENANHYNLNDKPVILAAYLKPFRLGMREQALPAARLLMAAIVSHGAYHLLLGENGAVLTQGYYSDYTVLTDEEQTVLRRYYDFMIQNLNLFYDHTLRGVSMTHFGGDNYEYSCSSHFVSVTGEADKIWMIIRENDEMKTISLINLCGCENDYWNEGKTQPFEQNNISFIVQVDCEIGCVYCDTPDLPQKSVSLPFSSIVTKNGKFIKFTVPELKYWSVVYIKNLQ